jgi:zinc protease
MSSRARNHATPSRFELDGGAVAFLEPTHAVPIVSIVIALRCGSAVDLPGKSGLARIALRMLRRGCEGMTAEQIDFRIDLLGGELAVDASPSSVAMHAQVIARSLDPFIDLLTRLLGTPTFPEDELERLKRETIAEIIEARDSDRVVAQKALQRTLFAGHPYGRNAGGTTETVRSIQRDDVLSFCRRFLVQGNLVIGMSGDVAPDRAPQLARKLVAGLPLGAAEPDGVGEPSMKPGRRLLLVNKPERTQTQILVATLGTSAHDEDHVDLVVSNAVFGGTFTSRLVREVRSKRGWSYGASSRMSVDRHRQAWLMWTFPAAQDAAACLKLTIDLLTAWVETGVSRSEVGFIQRYLVRSHAFEVDTAAKRLHQALDVDLLALPDDYYTAWVSRVRGVTPEGASSAAKRRIRVENLLIVVVGTAAQLLEPLRGAVGGLAETSVVAFDAE